MNGFEQFFQSSGPEGEVKILRVVVAGGEAIGQNRTEATGRPSRGWGVLVLGLIFGGAGGEAGAGHAFAEAAGLEEFLFELPELLIEQIVRLMDQADEDVRHGFAGAGFNKRPIGLVGLTVARTEFSDE